MIELDCIICEGGGILGDGEIKKHIVISSVLVSIVSIILVLISGTIYVSIKNTQEKEAQKYIFSRI